MGQSHEHSGTLQNSVLQRNHILPLWAVGFQNNVTDDGSLTCGNFCFLVSSVISMETGIRHIRYSWTQISIFLLVP